MPALKGRKKCEMVPIPELLHAAVLLQSTKVLNSTGQLATAEHSVLKTLLREWLGHGMQALALELGVMCHCCCGAGLMQSCQ